MNKLATALMLLVATTSISFAAPANKNPDRDPTRGFQTTVDSQTTSSVNHSASLPRYLIAKENAQQQPDNRLGERPDWAGNN